MTSKERHVVSNYRSFHCLFDRLCVSKSKKHQIKVQIGRNSPLQGPITQKKIMSWGHLGQWLMCTLPCCSLFCCVYSGFMNSLTHIRQGCFIGIMVLEGRRTDGRVGTLQWHHTDRDGVSNHQPHDCLPKRLFKRRSKKISKLRVTGLCEGNSPVTSTGLCAGNSPVTNEFLAQRASNTENVSIWWRHHECVICI